MARTGYKGWAPGVACATFPIANFTITIKVPGCRDWDQDRGVRMRNYPDRNVLRLGASISGCSSFAHTIGTKAI